jgi:hypothetical protein
MQLTGHKMRSVFERYNIIDRRDLRNATTKLEDIAGSVTAKRRRRAAVIGIAVGRR